MADDTKVDMEAKLRVSPMKEMGKEVHAFMKKNPALQKKFEKIEYSEKVKLDKRKWSPKKLGDGLGNVARYELKLLAVRFGKLIKDAEKGDQKKLEKDLTKEFESIKKEILDKVSLALEEVASGKGDNKKPLKACKASFDKMSKANFSGAFERPRNAVVKALEDVDKAFEKDGKGKPDFASAGKSVSAACAAFQKSGKLADIAIDSMVKTAKDLEKDKEADSSFVVFAKTILNYEKTFKQFTDMSKKFEAEIDSIEAALKMGKMEQDAVKAKIKSLKSMSNLDKTAQGVVSGTRKLKPAFQKIEKLLK